MLEFLQERFFEGLSLSTLEVYMVAISAYHALLDGQSLGRDPLVTRFLRGALRLRPALRIKGLSIGSDNVPGSSLWSI